MSDTDTYYEDRAFEHVMAMQTLRDRQKKVGKSFLEASGIGRPANDITANFNPFSPQFWKHPSRRITLPSAPRPKPDMV